VDVPSEDESVIIVPNCIFLRGHYPEHAKLPKSLLMKWKKEKEFYQAPVFTTIYHDKRFRSTVLFGGQKFRTDFWEKNRKKAEQAAALACLKYLGVIKD
jgi:dsRNA-specific ribonuclease